ncbi:MAG: DNA repair protein RecO [Planctomycetes bacterium]|nr:DNA repair protein RecO [Planctomycetota bacterium]
MAMERASALVIRGTDFSETSRIVTLWTKEFGKVRALAKGGRRLKSNFDVALDLLTVCGIVLIRKSTGSLDLLTEAQVQERFPQLRCDLAALYAGYYVAEMLNDWTQDHDPHPLLFDEALVTLRNLGQPGGMTGSCLAHFELVLLRELGYGPALDFCADCGEALSGQGLAFSAAGGGVVCPACQPRHRDKRLLADATRQALERLQAPGEAWREVQDPQLRLEVRQLLDLYVTYVLGRRPRLLPYLGS